jgi:hypothetical protein
MMLLPLLAALSFVVLQMQAPAVPAIVKDPDYPLRVQMAQTGSSSNGYGKSNSYGHGNLLGPPVEGFDYTADCNQRFAPRPEENQFFHARWKKQGLRLEILIQELGSDRIVACELKVAMREEPYELNGVRMGGMATLPRARPAVPVTEPDPNFPLRLQLWVTSSMSAGLAGSHTEGYGNLTGPPAQGFDFANECPVRLAAGRNNTDVYQARWVEQNLQLEILVQEVGTRQQSVCRMDVGMKSAPYPVPAPLVRTVPQATAPRSPNRQAPASGTELPPP